MSNKVVVIDLVTRLFDDVTLGDIAREIEFVAGVREGFEQLIRGESVQLEEAEKELSSWLIK